MSHLKLKLPIIIILSLGLLCGYFFITSGLPVGILCVPIILFFFRFSKEKLSAHINIFALLSTVFGLIFFHETWITNLRLIGIYFIVIIVLTILGRMLKKYFSVPGQILSLVYWGLLILAFLFLNVAHVDIGLNLGIVLKALSIFFSGALGIPTAPLLIPNVSICHENIILYLSIVFFSGLPAIVINLFKEFKIKNLDLKFSSYFTVALIIGSLLGGLVINFASFGEGQAIIWQISIILPCIGLFGFNLYNSIKTLKSLKENKK